MFKNKKTPKYRKCHSTLFSTSNSHATWLLHDVWVKSYHNFVTARDVLVRRATTVCWLKMLRCWLQCWALITIAFQISASVLQCLAFQYFSKYGISANMTLVYVTEHVQSTCRVHVNMLQFRKSRPLVFVDCILLFVLSVCLWMWISSGDNDVLSWFCQKRQWPPPEGLYPLLCTWLGHRQSQVRGSTFSFSLFILWPV